MIKKIFSSILITLQLIMIFGIMNPFVATAASITYATDTMSRLAASTAANHEFKFVIPSGVSAGQTIALTFASDFTGITGILYSDVDFASGDTSNCSTATFTEKTLASTPATTTWGVGSSGQVVTITSGTDIVATSKCVRIRIGTNTSTGGAGTNQITNGTTGISTITIGGTMADAGVISVPILSSDQVTLTAIISETVTFDLDVGYTVGDNSAPYVVALGTLSSGSVTRSNTSTVKQIFADGGTNSPGGMNVTVRNANGTNGLVSLSVNTDKIQAGGGTMASGTALYGICVDSASITGWSRSSTYNTTCTVNGATNQVPALSTAATDILTSTSQMSNGHAQVQVNASISTVTPAHSDYADTLNFVTTGSF
jgi:hypothetical protein